MTEYEKRIKELEEENEDLRNKNRQLKNRCHAQTKGLVCVWCNMDCENREDEFDPDFIPPEFISSEDK